MGGIRPSSMSRNTASGSRPARVANLAHNGVHGSLLVDGVSARWSLRATARAGIDPPIVGGERCRSTASSGLALRRRPSRIELDDRARIHRPSRPQSRARRRAGDARRSGDVANPDRPLNPLASSKRSPGNNETGSIATRRSSTSSPPTRGSAVTMPERRKPWSRRPSHTTHRLIACGRCMLPTATTSSGSPGRGRTT